MTEEEGTKGPRGASQVLAGDFSVEEAVGGWRGLVESALPGVVFVTSFVIWGGYKIPVILAVAVVAVMVVIRLIQKMPVTQALGGVLGVAFGAIWAWRVGDAKGFFVPGFWMTGAVVLGVLVSMLVKWPAVGIVVGVVRGWGSRWREDPAAMRTFQFATGFYVISQAIRLAIQLPLYFADATAALGTAKLLLGVPYFALTLWIVWLMVRRVELAPEPEDQPPPPR